MSGGREEAYAGRNAADYDERAAGYDWRAPEIAFGLSFEYVEPGDSILDIGIGTGLSSALFHKAGLRVFGMDRAHGMLGACRAKGFAAGLVLHDLRDEPWPYGDGTIDHALCLGVLGHIENAGPVFRQTGRILRPGGVFVFATIDRLPGESLSFEVGPEHTGTGEKATLHRRGEEEIGLLLDAGGFDALRQFAFDVRIDPEKTASMPMRCWVVARSKRDGRRTGGTME